MWLRLWPDMDWPMIWPGDLNALPIPSGGVFLYHATSELKAIAVEWSINSATYNTTDGVFADYLTEHRDELLTGATGPSDPAVRLDQLIDYLRSRFQSQFESTK